MDRHKILTVPALLLIVISLFRPSFRVLQARGSGQIPHTLSFTVTVTNNMGGYFRGLRPANFIVLIDKQPATVVGLTENDVPVSAAILFDASGSVSYRDYPRRLKILREAVAKFLESSNPSNEYFVLGFNKQPQLLLDWTSEPKAIAEAIGSVQAQGITAFYDACYLGIEKLQRGRYQKRAMIVISDGQDNNSHYTFRDLKELLKDSDVLFYSVNLFYADPGGSWLTTEGQRILNDLSSMSGGMTFYKKEGISLRTSDAFSVFQTIAGELRSQYSVAVRPPNFTGQKKWHKVQMRIELPANTPREMRNLTARTRQGYYSQ